MGNSRRRKWKKGCSAHSSDSAAPAAYRRPRSGCVLCRPRGPRPRRTSTLAPLAARDPGGAVLAGSATSSGAPWTHRELRTLSSGKAVGRPSVRARRRDVRRNEPEDHRSQAHLRRVLAAYLAYYHRARTHLSLGKDAPAPRRIQTPTEGRVVVFSEVGGLHHRYERRAA
jgi:hypothetical protein